MRAQVVPQELEPPAQVASPTECEPNWAHHRPVRLSWAKLLKRVFEIDLEHCPTRAGKLKIIEAIGHVGGSNPARHRPAPAS